MGALAGHIQHIHEDTSLTIADVRGLLNNLSQNKYAVTEKIDGINFYFTCDEHKNIRIARNKYDILNNKGLSLQDLQNSNKQYAGNLKDILLHFLSILQKSSKSITDEDINNTFKSGNLFYNCEIITNKFTNVYKYSQDSIIIHPSLHIMLEKGGTITKLLDIPNYKSLNKTIKLFNEAAINKFIAINPKIHVPKNDNKEKINSFFDKLLKNNKFINNNSTLLEYYINNLFFILQKEYTNLSDDILLQIANALYQNSENLSNLSLEPLVANELKQNKQYLLYESKKQIVLFIEEISQKLLNNIKSNFIKNPEEQSEKIKHNIDKIMKNLTNIAMNDVKIYYLMLDYQDSLKDFQKNNYFCEGLVFYAGSNVYKVTGLFSKINKLYNLQKNMPNTDQILDDKNRKIALFAGSYKPPHKGHFEVVRNIAKKVDFVNIYISPLPRDHKNHIFGPSLSEVLWKFYLKTYKIDNVNVILSEFSSPITMTYEFLLNNKNLPNLAQKNDKIYIVVSTKDVDKRYAGLEQYNKNNADLNMLIYNTITHHLKDNVPLSSSEMRKSIVEKNLQVFSKYIPELCAKEAEKLLNYLHDNSKVEL